MTQRFPWWLTWGGVVALTLLVLNIGFTLQNTRRVYAESKWVDHTYQVMNGLLRLQTALRDAQGGERTYLLTGQVAYLDAYTASSARALATLDEVQGLTSDNPTQERRIPELRTEIVAGLEALRAQSKRRDTPGYDPLKDPDTRATYVGPSPNLVASRPELAKARGVIDAMFDLEQRLLAGRSNVARSTYQGALSGAIAIGLVALFAVAAAILILSRFLYARNMAVNAISEQAERLRITLSSIGDAVVITDDKGIITGMNPVAEHLTGWSLKDAEGESLSTIFRIENEITRKQVESPADRALREGIVVGLANHTVLIAKDGTEWPIDDRAAPIRDVQGLVQGVVLVFRDVTDDRAAQRNQALLASIVQNSDDAIMSKTLEGVIVSWNEGSSRLFGYTAAEAIGQPIQLIIPPDLFDEEAAILNRVVAGEHIDHFETARIDRSGRRTDMSLSISPLSDSAGRIIGASTIGRDISDRKRREDEARFLSDASSVLAESLDAEAALRVMARLAVPAYADWCAIYTLDGGGQLHVTAIEHSDPAKVQLIRDLLLRSPISPDGPGPAWRVIRSQAPELIPEITDEMLVAALPDQELLRVYRQMKFCSQMGVPIKAHGKVFGMITFVMAESGRRYTPHDLQVAEDLARRAGITIENANLFHALQAADKRKDQFLATLSHELRNPLAPILYSLEIAKAARGSGQDLEQAHSTIERQVGHLVRLVDDLLDMSRISQDKLELRLAKTELGDVIRHAVEIARPLAISKQQEIDVVLPGETVLVDGDRARLTQAVSNVLTNACKFTQPQGSISVRLAMSDGQALISVRDNGIGIPPERLAEVWDIFFQVESSRDGAEGGLGIGLTLVRRLVEMHGGSAEILSGGRGKGVEVIIRLPIAVGNVASAPATDNIVASTARRVLVVEDNIDGAMALAQLLRLAGHEVTLAHDGLAALEMAEAFHPDVVFLDIGLPKLNGHEVAKRIRSREWGRKLFLVALTGWGQEEDRLESRKAGFNEHLVKPITHASLLEIMTKLDQDGEA